MMRTADDAVAPSGPGNQPINLDPISVRVARAVELTGVSRSTLYELISAGRLEVTKVGRSTLISYRSLRRLVEG